MMKNEVPQMMAAAKSMGFASRCMVLGDMMLQLLIEKWYAPVVR